MRIEQYEYERILGLSVTFNGTSVLFSNVYLPVNSTIWRKLFRCSSVERRKRLVFYGILIPPPTNKLVLGDWRGIWREWCGVSGYQAAATWYVLKRTSLLSFHFIDRSYDFVLAFVRCNNFMWLADRCCLHRSSLVTLKLPVSVHSLIWWCLRFSHESVITDC